MHYYIPYEADQDDKTKKTIFIDIDGTLIKHQQQLDAMVETAPEVLPGVMEQLEKWLNEGHLIILTTGRPEHYRDITHGQLVSVGIRYHRLIMGITTGERWVINDTKPDMSKTAHHHIVERNTGFPTLL